MTRIYIALIALVIALPFAARAQDNSYNAAAALKQPQIPATPGTGAIVVKPALTEEEKLRPFTGSFFLSPLEIAAIQRALAGQTLSQQTLAGDTRAIPARRRILVSGVLYRAPEDWIVWMNGQKVTPDNLLPEIIDISVKDSSKVSLKWYDVGLNQVISITLRPHQIYDIVSGVLLPGSQ